MLFEMFTTGWNVCVMASDANGHWAHGCRWWWWWNVCIQKIAKVCGKYSNTPFKKQASSKRPANIEQISTRSSS